jgi:hypothetical protein
VPGFTVTDTTWQRQEPQPPAAPSPAAAAPRVYDKHELFTINNNKKKNHNEDADRAALCLATT